MTYEEAIQRIESVQFSVEINVVSSLTSMINAVRSEAAAGVLSREIASERGWRAVCDRVFQLVRDPVDPGFENPHDVALAAYLLAAYWFDIRAGRMFARWINTAKNLSWAARICNHMLRQQAPLVRQVRLGGPFSRSRERPRLRGSGAIDHSFLWGVTTRPFPYKALARFPAPGFKVVRVEQRPGAPSIRYSKKWKEAA